MTDETDADRSTTASPSTRVPDPVRSPPRDDENRCRYRVKPGGGVGPLERREYLRVLGGAGLAGALGIGTVPGVSAYAEPDPDWEGRADARIEEHRTGDLEVVVEDTNGNPVSDVAVTVEMQAHDYGFGVALSAPVVLEDSDDAEQYREHVPELFNKAVFGNHHKWRFFEENQEVADEATQWVLEQGLDLRGHTCIWGARQHYAVPADVEDAIEAGDAEHIRERSLEHIETIISHYGDDIEEWDVVNEALHEIDLVEGIYGDDVDEDEPWAGAVVPWRSPILTEWYETAREVADQEGVQIAVNDFNTLSGPHDYARDWYTEQIEFLLEEGIDLDGIGMQCHFDESERLTPEQLLKGLDRYAEYGAELRATEFDTFQGEWESDEQKAEYLHTFLKTFFSHPKTADFVVWGFWDGDHWGDDAPLFYEDWTPKPGYDAYVDLVFEEWWTDEGGTTDHDGTYITSVFLGEHEVTVTTSERTTTEGVSVTDSSGATQLVVTVDGEGDDGGEVPADLDVTGDGNPAQDLSGDGLYEDVTGDGRLGFDDVVAFFEEHEGAVVQDNAELFDFSGGDRVGFVDVIALFEML